MPKRTQVIGVRLEPGEAKALASIAAQEQRSVSQLIRLLILKLISTKGLKK